LRGVMRQGWERQPAGGSVNEAGGGRADVRKPLKTPWLNNACAEDYKRTARKPPNAEKISAFKFCLCLRKGMLNVGILWG